MSTSTSTTSSTDAGSASGGGSTQNGVDDMSTTPTGSQQPSTSAGGSDQPVKKKPEDFIFGKMVGEGSFSSVYLAKDVKTGKEYAIKVCDKQHIIREKKTESIRREKEIMTILSANREPTAPYFVHLYATFQDAHRLYFLMTFACGGELLKQLMARKRFGKKLSQFYGAEIVQALRHLHKLKICHRDLKPENILLNEDGHILITDFGSGKELVSIPVVATQEPAKGDPERPVSGRTRSNSFVGTAQYVSPEILQGRYSDVGPAADLWALGCILFQFLTGHPPFQGASEFLIFKKILSLDYQFPENFDEDAKDIIIRLLQIQFTDRLGAKDEIYYTSIQSHPFFSGLDFSKLHEQKVPLLEEDNPSCSIASPLKLIKVQIPPDYAPGFNPRVIAERFLRSTSEENISWGDDRRISFKEIEDSSITSSQNDNSADVNSTTELLNTMNIVDAQTRCNSECIGSPPRRCSKGKIIFPSDAQDRLVLLAKQAEGPWHKCVKGNLILKQGLVTKRKGLFSRRRMLLLTEGPHLFYGDPNHMTIKGEIPWSEKLRPEARDFKMFNIQTPNRTYYLEDPEGFALAWCEAISLLHQQTYNCDPPTATALLN